MGGGASLDVATWVPVVRMVPRDPLAWHLGHVPGALMTPPRGELVVIVLVCLLVAAMVALLVT